MSENLPTFRSTEAFRNVFQVTNKNNSYPTDDTDELPEWQIQILESNLQFFCRRLSVCTALVIYIHDTSFTSKNILSIYTNTGKSLKPALILCLQEERREKILLEKNFQETVRRGKSGLCMKNLLGLPLYAGVVKPFQCSNTTPYLVCTM